MKKNAVATRAGPGTNNIAGVAGLSMYSSSISTATAGRAPGTNLVGAVANA